MNSCDFRVFLQEFGTTVHLSLPGSVSEKERLLLKLLMQGMSVTGFAPIFPDTCYHLTHYWPAAADIPV
ncbi:hypothetical protein P2N84_22270, partial [Escherichia coli]